MPSTPGPLYHTNISSGHWTAGRLLLAPEAKAIHIHLSMRPLRLHLEASGLGILVFPYKYPSDSAGSSRRRDAGGSSSTHEVSSTRFCRFTPFASDNRRGRGLNPYCGGTISARMSGPVARRREHEGEGRQRWIPGVGYSFPL